MKRIIDIKSILDDELDSLNHDCIHKLSSIAHGNKASDECTILFDAVCETLKEKGFKEEEIINFLLSFEKNHPEYFL